MNSINNEKFGHPQLKTHLFYLNSAAEIMIKHLQPHLPCPNNNEFGSDIERALGPNRPVQSLGSLYL